jgi:hypothetical protein
VVGIEPTRVGKHPHGRCAERLRLEPDGGARPVEGDPVGSNTDDRNTPGTKAANLPGESLPGGAELIVAKLRGSGRSPPDEVGDTDTILEQLVLLRRLQ